MTSRQDAFAATQGFPLDEFQIGAIDALVTGHSVLVAAPTGAGKTVVGEFCCDDALATGGKSFYTTPIKALSNQKFRDLARRTATSASACSPVTGRSTARPPSW
jgi:ATP-dependent RNA helicase HelY